MRTYFFMRAATARMTFMFVKHSVVFEKEHHSMVEHMCGPRVIP